MSSELKTAASAIAVVISFVAYVPYVVGMLHGENKPHIFAWTSIFLITCVVGILQLVGGAGIGALPTLIGVIAYLVIIVLSLRFGTKDIIKLDIICLGLSLIGILAYIALREKPAIALIIVTVAELIGFMPTWRKTKNAPNSESLSSYYFLVVKLLLILVALQRYNFLTLANTITWLIVMLGFISTTHYWRHNSTQTAKPSIERDQSDQTS